jgi:hypothetical protein
MSEQIHVLQLAIQGLPVCTMFNTQILDSLVAILHVLEYADQL